MVVTPKTVDVTVNVAWDRLAVMMEQQRELQLHAKPVGRDPTQITDPDELIQFLRDMREALEAELQEAIDEIGWKPWTTSNHVNRDAMLGELVDAWHFFMNMLLALHASPQEFYDKYQEKRLRNIARWEAEGGYDGLANKCWRCKRDFGDIAIARGIDRSGLTIFHTPEGEVCSNCVTEQDMRTS